MQKYGLESKRLNDDHVPARGVFRRPKVQGSTIGIKVPHRGLVSILVARSSTLPYQKESRGSKKDSEETSHLAAEVSIRLDEVLATYCHSMAQSQDCRKLAA